ncbi:MAG: Patatin [Alphaproteobacteria bacterium]|jgi:NTE family protein|nr:Patatin [Alphaproteobacteria bacterium]
MTVHTINLALQGGGAHGAFTWGVLDRLLEDDGIAIEGISGTSAGAVNAVVLAQGFADGGATGARAALDDFWGDLANFAPFSPAQRTFVDWLTGNWNLDRSPASMVFDMFTRLVSPYEGNPANLNALRHLLSDRIDLAKVRSCHPLKLFISATSVRTGKGRVFQGPEITLDAILASACLPTVFQAVTIDGEPYWDGGYTGNPAIWPLIYGCDSRDVAIVQINPLLRDETPRSSAEIMNRLNEITFNSALIGEMRAIATVQRLIENGELTEGAGGRLKKMLIHLIGDPDEMRDLGVASKFNLHRDFLEHLKAVGRSSAHRWLEANRDRLGRKSTIDIRATFL